MEAKRNVVELRRKIPAPPSQVYRALLDPKLVREWLAPGDSEVTRVEIDERVGGHYRVWQADATGSIGGFESEILELVPGKRVVFRWGFVGPERTRGPVIDSRLTITLRPTRGGGTEVTLLHERLEGLAAEMPWVAENVGPGWDMVLDKLVAAIAEEA